jgi:N-acetylglucosaminyldiphosphoundecaprenol N-acetyl-beta-D-mannosaminyltransferase
MPSTNVQQQAEYDLEQRAKFLSVRRELLLELDGRLSADGIRHRKRSYLRHSLGWLVAKRTANTLRRVIDIVISAFFLVLTSPILLVSLIIARLRGGGLVREERLGRWATHFGLFCLNFRSAPDRYTFFQRLPALLNVLRGDMSFIGPRPIPPSEEFAEKRHAWKRYDLRPGLLSLWWIRKRANIAHTSEVSLDLEYVETKSFWGDLGIAARAIPAAMYGSGVSNAPPRIHFLGVRMDNLTMAEASDQIVTLARSEKPSQVCFVNADCVNIACTDADYRSTLAKASLVLADGIGVRIAGAILDQNVRENVNGTDMLPFLCSALEAAGLSLYLLGGKPGVAEDAGKWITQHYPGLKLAGHRDGYFSAAEEPAVLDSINASGANVVLVGMGAPRQDKWIANHKDLAGARVMIGVGGLLDFYSGRIPRAPVWVRELGMEWFYRFMQEPKRMFHRYFVGNFDFLYRVLGERIRMRSANRVEGNAG